MLTSEKMQEILVDAQLGRSRPNANAEEKAFRKKMDAEVAAAKKSGATLSIPKEWVGAK